MTNTIRELKLYRTFLNQLFYKMKIPTDKIWIEYVTWTEGMQGLGINIDIGRIKDCLIHELYIQFNNDGTLYIEVVSYIPDNILNQGIDIIKDKINKAIVIFLESDEYQEYVDKQMCTSTKTIWKSIYL